MLAESVSLERIMSERLNITPASNALKIRSPGRVNLIGEHTDYNEGFVLPAAIDKEILGIAEPSKDSIVNVWSEDFKEAASFDLNDSGGPTRHWTDYIKGVANELSKIKQITRGFKAVFTSNLPAESGLSSSAAFELINAFLLAEINGIAIDRKKMALLCQKAENSFIGVKCGIMDQFAISLGEADCALFIDTRSLEYEAVPLAMSKYAIIIGNTKKPRTLSGSAYNIRRDECEQAVRAMKKVGFDIAMLRDADLIMLDRISKSVQDKIYKRARHVITENRRVLASVAALKRNDLAAFGAFMNDSHASLRDDFEVSCLELDIMSDAARKTDGCIGSRMTGAGFGGCTVSLVEHSKADSFINKVGEAYSAKTGLYPQFYITTASAGTEILTEEQVKK